MRLDEFLIREKLATQEQVQEALDYQRSHGDRLETHLFRFGYVGEAELVGALSKQFCYPGVSLSDLEIPDEVLRLLPAEVVREKLAVPFHYDALSKVVKVACENPRQGKLREELAGFLAGKTIELYLSLGVTLRLVIARYYRWAPAAGTGSTGGCDMEMRSGVASKAEATAVPMAALEAPEVGPPITAAPVGSRTAGKPAPGKECRLLLLDSADHGIPSLSRILRYQGYHVTKARSVEIFVQAALDYRPNIMLLMVSGNKLAVIDIIGQLALRGISISSCPTFLVANDLNDDDVGELLRIGFEDIVQSENILDLLMIRLHRVRERLAVERSRRLEIIQQSGTHGSLEDMDVCDLLQTMGSLGKTARISVSGDGNQLTVYLDQGHISYAECDNTLGAEAVYGAFGWKHGVWSVDPVSPEDLPEPNNHATNDAILLEGCRRLDENSRMKSQTQAGDSFAVLDQRE